MRATAETGVTAFVVTVLEVAEFELVASGTAFARPDHSCTFIEGEEPIVLERVIVIIEPEPLEPCPYHISTLRPNAAGAIALAHVTPPPDTPVTVLEEAHVIKAIRLFPAVGGLRSVTVVESACFCCTSAIAIRLP